MVSVEQSTCLTFSHFSPKYLTLSLHMLREGGSEDY